MYRRILVPVDGSATSTLGLKQALGLAKDQRARVRVLNVVDEAVVASAMDPYGAADIAGLFAREVKMRLELPEPEQQSYA